VKDSKIQHWRLLMPVDAISPQPSWSNAEVGLMGKVKSATVQGPRSFNHHVPLVPSRIVQARRTMPSKCLLQSLPGATSGLGPLSSRRWVHGTWRPLSMRLHPAGWGDLGLSTLQRLSVFRALTRDGQIPQGTSNPPCTKWDAACLDCSWSWAGR
jgi:hypothetical protein